MGFPVGFSRWVFQVGQQFPCFYSQKELGLVMTELDYNEVNRVVMMMMMSNLAIWLIQQFVKLIILISKTIDLKKVEVSFYCTRCT